MKLFRPDPTCPFPRFDAHIRVSDDLGSPSEETVLAYLSRSDILGGFITTNPHTSDRETVGSAPGGKPVLHFAQVGESTIPNQIVGFAGLHLEPLVRGIPGDDVLQYAAGFKWPTLIYGGEGFNIAKTIRLVLPKTAGPVIIAHLGSWQCSAETLSAAVDLAAKESRVYLETSGACIGNFLQYASKMIPNKLLFGSCRPIFRPYVQWSHVAASVLDDQTLEKIAWENANRILNV